MIEEKLVIGEAILRPIVQSIDDTLSSLEKPDEQEKSFRSLSETANKIKNFSDFEETPENKFVSFLGWSMISIAQMNLKKTPEKSDQSTPISKKENDMIKESLAEYLINIKQGFQEKSYQKIVEASKNFFNLLSQF
jgi:hypothetical protein